MAEDTSNEMDTDEIELELRRYASKNKDNGLSKLLDSLFTTPVGQEEPGEKDNGQD